MQYPFSLHYHFHFPDIIRHLSSPTVSFFLVGAMPILSPLCELGGGDNSKPAVDYQCPKLYSRDKGSQLPFKQALLKYVLKSFEGHVFSSFLQRVKKVQCNSKCSKKPLLFS